jgi:hypothetical protein
LTAWRPGAPGKHPLTRPLGHGQAEQVVHHVRWLEQNAETAVQMHFFVQSNRANEIMRTLSPCSPCSPPSFCRLT